MAAALQPERAPYFVRLPIPAGLENTFPAQGWYWAPAGQRVVTFLAPSFELAAIRLHELIVAQDVAPSLAVSSDVKMSDRADLPNVSATRNRLRLVREAERRMILGEWVAAVLRLHGWDLPVDDVERELRVMSDPVEWALTGDALTLAVLGVNDVLCTVSLTEDGEATSTVETALRGEPIRVHRTQGQQRPWRDTGRRREFSWTFTYLNGGELLTLTGTITTDRVRAGESRDRGQRLAEAISELADRNASSAC